MNRPTVFQKIWYVLCTVLLLALPLSGPDGQLLLLAAVTAVTAYEGLRLRLVSGLSALVLGAEVFYGMDVGVTSLAYVCAVGLLWLVGRFVTLTFWSQREGWRFWDGFRSFVLAWALYVCTISSAVVFGHLLYGYRELAQRYELLLSADTLLAPVWMSVLVLMMLRRLVIPFHREILFGT